MSRIYRTTVLTTIIGPRALFDPTNAAHIEEIKYFLSHKKWKTTCPFIGEGSFDNIAIDCIVKYAKHQLKID